MDLVHVIRHKVLVEGVSARKVAEQMGVSRNTVRKYLTHSEPRREESEPRSKPQQETIRPHVEELLEGRAGQTDSKQRWTSPRIVELLAHKGIVASDRTVRRVMAEYRRRKAEVYVPLVYQPGEVAEVDFFEVRVQLPSGRQKAWLFVMREMYSGRDYAWLYPRQDQVAFLDGHVRAFAYFGCVPQRIIYDNLKAAVRRILVGSGRLMTTRFTALASHYLFEPCFARPGQGHDKGGVEARGKGIRWQHLVPIPTGSCLDEISAHLLTRLDDQAAQRRNAEGTTVMERFEHATTQMLHLPPRRFDAARHEAVKVSSRATVRIDNAFYSVPETWARRTLMARVGVDFVEVMHEGQRVRHARQRPGGRSIRYCHYLGELSRKPQALRQVAGPLLEELGVPFGRVWRDLVDQHGPIDAARHFGTLLERIRETDLETVRRQVLSALEHQRSVLLTVRPPEPPPPRIGVPAGLAEVEITGAAASAYDRLLEVTL